MAFFEDFRKGSCGSLSFCKAFRRFVWRSPGVLVSLRVSGLVFLGHTGFGVRFQGFVDF